MKFPRNARMFRGQLDAAPYASVLFLLLIFILLGTLVYTPGSRIELPMSSSDLPGVDGPTVAVGVDANGELYFENQVIQKKELQARLRNEVAKTSQPLTLIVQADKSVRYEQCVALADLARAAGIRHALLETLPRMFDSRAAGDHAPQQ